MKILAYPVIPNQTCSCCHSFISINTKDLRWNAASLSNDAWKCPVCKTLNTLKWLTIDIVNEQKQNNKKVGKNK